MDDLLDSPVPIDISLPVSRDVLRCTYRCIECGTQEQAAWTLAAGRGASKLTIERCRKCRGRNFQFIDGVYGLITVSKEHLPRLIASAESAIPSLDVWTMLCDLLDSIRVRMGDGSYSNRMCVVCERTHIDGQCRCGCHAAWAYRQRITESARRAA